MDRRMYRGNVGCGCGYTPARKPVSPYKAAEPVCGDIVAGYTPDDICEKPYDYCDGDFDRFPLAMAYVPWQKFRHLYENEFDALAKGTLFKELDLDWYGRGCK